MAKSLWNIGTGDAPIIQGQAGKPFLHQQGGDIQFAQGVQQKPGTGSQSNTDPQMQTKYSDTVVSNKCLCSYKWYRYFAIYAHMPQNIKSLPFYQTDPASFQDETVQKPGYAWQLKTGYIYQGCKPKQGSLGVWQDMPFPYRSEGHDPNISTPSPSCIKRTNTGFPTVKKMLVTSYKCCNGQAGCGKLTDAGQGSQADPLLDTQRFYCQGWFNVSFDQEGKVQNRLSLQAYNTRCGKGHHAQKVQYTSCTTAKVRVFRQVFSSWLTDPSQEQCADCYSKLNTNLLNIRPPICVNWALYRWNISGAQGCKVMTPPDLIVNYEGLPPTVVGKGGGCAPFEWHDTQPIYICQDQTTPGSLGGAIYQWIPSDNCSQPANPPYNAPANKCKNHCQYPGTDLQWDAPLTDGSKRDSTQAPCNLPDPPPYQYLQETLTAPVTWQKFDVYRVRLHDMSEAQAIEKGLDPCKNWYTPQKWDGDTTKTRWTKHLTAKNDYQLINYIQTPIQQSDVAQPDQSGNPQEVKKYKYLYQVVAAGQQVDVDFTATSGKQDVEAISDGNKQCDYYFQVYFAGPKQDCSQQQSVKSFVCAKWRPLGKMSQQQQGKLGLVKNMWQTATKQNTFGLAQSYPQIICVYTVSFQKPAWCGQHPKVPQYHKTACVLPIPPACQSAAQEGVQNDPNQGADTSPFQYDPVESALQKGQWEFREVSMSCQQYLQQHPQQGQPGKCIICYGLVDIFSVGNKQFVAGQDGFIMQNPDTAVPQPDQGEGEEAKPICYAEYAVAIQEYWGASKQQIRDKLAQIVDDLPELEDPCESLTAQQKVIPPQLHFKYRAECYQGSKYIPVCAQIQPSATELTQAFWQQVEWKKLSPIELDATAVELAKHVQGFRTACEQPQYGQAVPVDQQTGIYRPVTCKPIHYVTFLVQCKDQPQPKPNPKLCPVGTKIEWPAACCVKFWALQLTPQTSKLEMQTCEGWQQVSIGLDKEDTSYVSNVNSLMSSVGYRTSLQLKTGQDGPVFGDPVEGEIVVSPKSCKPIYYIATTDICQELQEGQQAQDIRPECPSDSQVVWPYYCCGNLVYMQFDSCTKTVEWDKIEQQDWKPLQLFGPRDQWTQETWLKAQDVFNNRLGWRTSIKDEKLGQAVEAKDGSPAPTKCQPIYYVTMSNANCAGGPAATPGGSTTIAWPAGCTIKFRYFKWQSPNKNVTDKNCKWAQLSLPQRDDLPEVKTQLARGLGWRTSIDVFYANQGAQFGAPVHATAPDFIVPYNCDPIYYIQAYDSCDEEASAEPQCPITTVSWPAQCCAGFKYIQVDPISNGIPQECTWKDIAGSAALQPEQKKALLQCLGWRTSIDTGAKFGKAVPVGSSGVQPQSCKDPIYYIQSYDACVDPKEQLTCPNTRILWPLQCRIKFFYFAVSAQKDQSTTTTPATCSWSQLTITDPAKVSEAMSKTGWRTSNEFPGFGQAVHSGVAPQNVCTLYYITYVDTAQVPLGQQTTARPTCPASTTITWQPSCWADVQCQDGLAAGKRIEYTVSGTATLKIPDSGIDATCELRKDGYEYAYLQPNNAYASIPFTFYNLPDEIGALDGDIRMEIYCEGAYCICADGKGWAGGIIAGIIAVGSCSFENMELVGSLSFSGRDTSSSVGWGDNVQISVVASVQFKFVEG